MKHPVMWGGILFFVFFVLYFLLLEGGFF